MKPVGADDEVAVPVISTFERDRNARVCLFDASDRIAKDGFGLTLDRPKYRGCELSARNADKAAPHGTAECFCGKSRCTPAIPVDSAHFPYPISLSFDLLQDPHTVSDLVSGSPEIDDIAAGSQFRGLLHRGSLHPIANKPVGQSRTCDASA
jgi:hypothetical protein